MPKIKPPRPVLPPEQPGKKSVGLLLFVYGVITLLVVGLLSLFLTQPTTY